MLADMWTQVPLPLFDRIDLLCPLMEEGAQMQMDLPYRATYNEEYVGPYDHGLTAIYVTELAILHVTISDGSMPKSLERSSE
jgi:hypothetical protein